MTRLIVSLLIIALTTASTAFSKSPDLQRNGSIATPATSAVDNATYIDANLILMFVQNTGGFGRDRSDVFGYDYGTFYPFTSIYSIQDGSNTTSPLYASGLWLGGLVNGQPRVAVAEYSNEYVPGPMAGGTFLPDAPEFRVYKLYSDSLASQPNADYQAWPVDQGAPVDNLGRPQMRGTQMLWTVFNDADPNQHDNNGGETEPLGIEVQQTVWATDSEDPEAYALYLQYRLINKGSNTVDSMYLSLWSDPDVGGASDDLVGCDPENDVWFAYNSNNNDQRYGSRPPAIGFRLLQGPLVPSVGSIGISEGHPVFDHTNLGLTSFQRYINGDDPVGADETYCSMKGRVSWNGCVEYTYNGQPTTFGYAGDPLTGDGDLDIAPADRRMVATSGPFTFNPGDTQSVLIKMAIGQGNDRLSSIMVMRYFLAQNPWSPLVGTCIAVQDSVSKVDSMLTVYIGDVAGVATSDIDEHSLFLNDVLPPTEIVYQAHTLGFSGDVYRLKFNLNQAFTEYRRAGLVPYFINGRTNTGRDLYAYDWLVYKPILAGDINGDGSSDLTDITLLVNHVFLGGPPPLYPYAADAYCDGAGRFTLTDITRLINYIFLSGPEPQICDYWLP